jgi:hypothetical protein
MVFQVDLKNFLFFGIYLPGVFAAMNCLIDKFFVSIYRGIAMGNNIWGCVTSLFLALRAKLSFDRHIIFEISQSEISKMMCLSK